MAHFTNQLDKIATELGSSVIFAHHHSKGSQAGKKSMDRASGSGVSAVMSKSGLFYKDAELTKAGSLISEIKITSNKKKREIKKKRQYQ